MRNLALCFIIISGGLVCGQSNSQPFVKISTQPINIGANTTKEYLTTLTVVFNSNNVSALNETALNETVFVSAANAVYGETLSGFISPAFIISINTVSSNESTVTYRVRYSYTALNDSVSGSNEQISATIGNVTYLREKFEVDQDFSSLYSISDNGFTYSGVSLCTSAGCATYAPCHEVNNGVSITCQSVCYDNFCLNGGYCHHDDPNTRPVCSCSSFFDSWYVGNHCQTLFQVWMMALFFVIVFLILVALIPIIACLCIKQIPKRIKKKEEKAKKALEKERIKAELNSKAMVEKQTVLAAALQSAEETGQINSSFHATSASTPVPAPRHLAASTTPTPQRNDSTSSSESSSRHSPSSRHSTTPSLSHNQREPRGFDDVQVASASPPLAESTVSSLYQEIPGTAPNRRMSDLTSSSSSSSSDMQTDAYDSSGISAHEITDDRPSITYNEPPVYAEPNKPISLYFEKPLISTV